MAMVDAEKAYNDINEEKKNFTRPKRKDKAEAQAILTKLQKKLEEELLG